MRHHPYRIGIAEHDQWLMCMRTALAEQMDDLVLRTAGERKFFEMADHLINCGRSSGCLR